MVDVIHSKEESNGEQIKRIVGKTQGMLKSRMMSFLGSSSEIISGISTKLESALSLSESAYSEETSTKPVTTPSSHTGSEHGPAMPSISRKLNSLPAFGMTFEDYEAMVRHRKKNYVAEEYRLKCHQNRIQFPDRPKDDTSPSGACNVISEENEDIEKDSLKCDGSTDAERELSSMHLSQSVDSNVGSCHLVATGPDPYDKLKVSEIPSSGSASDLDGYGPSTSIESSGRKYWVRSGSEGSVQSWASSLSLDSQSDEAAVEFMREFVVLLFKDSSSIHLDQKAKFGELCQSEPGRLWFARFVNAQRAKSKQVSETTFYALIQYFATVLFECAEADDFSPAKSLMNMCFTFYLEVEVPGCEPYKEYLYIYLRDQPIWHTLRFWNAAFFDALQCERVHKPIATRDDVKFNSIQVFMDDKQYQENITFGQLGTFTYNMHAFGLSRELCMEFLRKQCIIANLSKEQESILKENVDKMYKETDPWRS